MTIEVNGKSIQTDNEGYLVDPDEWNEEVAKQLAQGEAVEMTDKHWKVIGFMRDYYDEHQSPADVRHVTKFIANELGCGKKEAKKCFFEVFPFGHVQQCCKIAGMRRPRIWSTG